MTALAVFRPNCTVHLSIVF